MDEFDRWHRIRKILETKKGPFFLERLISFSIPFPWDICQLLAGRVMLSIFKNFTLEYYGDK